MLAITTIIGTESTGLANMRTKPMGMTTTRIRTIMPVLAAEGGDTRNLARLASRLARANAAVEVLVDGAERYLALKASQPSPPELS